MDGIHPIVLMATMLVEKGILNENELSWIKNSHLMSKDQVEFVEGDPEERKLCLMSMRQMSFIEARKIALDKLRCPVCEGAIEESGIVERHGQLIPIIVSKPFHCLNLNCGKTWEYEELVRVEGKHADVDGPADDAL